MTETFQRGIFSQHLQQSHGLHGLDDTLGSGACVFDMDNDGDLDAYFVAGLGATRFYGKKHWWSDQPQGQLYRNDGHGNFTLITDNTGLPTNLWGMGCNSADIDNDGFEDLILTNRGENWIAYGNGQGSFTSVKLEGASNWSTSVSLADVNNDGLLDIYIGNYIKFQKNTKTFESTSGFTRDDTPFSPQNFPAQANEFHLNIGNRKFVERAREYNLSNADGRTLGAQWLDSNNDEWLDLLVINDKGSEPQLFINLQGESFKRAPLQQQIDSPGGLRNATALSLYNDASQPISVYSSALGMAPYLLQKTNNKHSNITWDKVLGPDKLEGLSHWGVANGDFNGDGLDDLYLGAGFAHPDSDAHRLPQGQQDTLLLQTETGKLYKQTNVFEPAIATRAVISVDIDNDGDTDLLLTHNNGSAQLKVNHSNPKHWIGLDIRNQFGQRNHYKSIEVKQKDKAIGLRPVADGFLSNRDYRHIPPLFKDDDVNVIVHWLDGTHSEYPNLPPNQYYLLSQDQVAQLLVTPKLAEKIATPLTLAYWQIKADKVGWQGVLQVFSVSNSANKITLLQEAHLADNHPLLLAFIEIALNQGNSLDNLTQVLQEQELEMSLPLVLHQIQRGPNCKTAAMVHAWFNEEEAMLLSKNLFSRPLMRQLDNASPSQQKCILHALSESRQSRPVAAIEQLLTTSSHKGVRKTAIYSLGELRRTRSIKVIEPFLKVPLLAKDAKVALLKLRSKHAPTIHQTPSFPNDMVLLKPSSNNIAPCPRMTIEKVLALPHRQQATLFSLCSQSSLQTWLSNNSTQLTNSIKIVLSNQQFSASQLDLVLRNIKGNTINGYDLLLLGLLDSTPEHAKKTVILKAMAPYGERTLIQTAAKNILENTQLSQALRIAAGDLLIDHNPALVMKHSDTIFNEL